MQSRRKWVDLLNVQAAHAIVDLTHSPALAARVDRARALTSWFPAETELGPLVGLAKTPKDSHESAGPRA